MKVNWNVNISVAGGPSIPLSGFFETEAYDVIEVVIPKESSVPVEVQPGETGDVLGLLITSTRYSDLTFKVDDSDPQILDGPLSLIGAGLVKILGPTQNVILFENESDATDVKVTILVARTATEEGV